MKRVILLLLLTIPYCLSDFLYPDFNHTQGLAFNGNATSSVCGKQPPLPNLSTIQFVNGYETKVDITRDTDGQPQSISKELLSTFGHRDVYGVSSNSKCIRRLRLTPSLPSQVGSVFYERRVSVLKGFDTTFTFQMGLDQSKVCTQRIDPMTLEEQYKSCSVHGGDGFAFVIHADERGFDAIGKDGQQLGFGGIRNSLAIEFDSWGNVELQGSDDLYQDHIALHSASTGANSANASTMLGYWKPTWLADGKRHRARVQYLSYIEEKYFDQLSGNENLIPYLKDNGEGRRVGTLAVFIDEGVQDSKPLIAIPLNLSVLLSLPQSLAYVGFTASTGERFQTHDVLDWHWCDNVDCQGDQDEIARTERGFN